MVKFLTNDLWVAFTNPKPWLALVGRNIKAAYRRSYLGAIWISLTVAITIAALSGVYTFLFPVSLEEYMPFLTVSYISWIAISNILMSGPTVFIQYSGFIQEGPSIYSNYVIAVVVDKLVILANQTLVIVVVFLIFGVPVTSSWLVVPLSVAIYFVTGIGLGFLTGLFASYLRDAGQLIGSVVQLMFFVTPVLWKPEFLTGRQFIVDYNPFYHYLAIVREPLLDNSVPWDSFAVTIAIALLSLLAGVAAMSKYRNQLVHWV